MKGIRLCTENDIEKLMEIGEKTFKETFEEENIQEDIENYCRKNFSYEKISSEINDKNSRYFVFEEKNQVVGYMLIFLEVRRKMDMKIHWNYSGFMF